MPKKGENIYKRKDGRWEARYVKGVRENGKPMYGYLYAKTYKEVKEKKIAALTLCQEASIKVDNNIIEEKIFFKDISSKWLESLKEIVKESTYVKYFFILQQYLIPSFGESEVVDINFEKVNNFSRYLLKSGGNKKSGLAPKTVTDILYVLKSILKFARNCGNKIDCDLNSLVIKQRPLSLKVLSVEEQTKLTNYLFFNLNEKNFGILLCLFTGIRVGELCALKWSDISLSNKIIFIHATMQRVQNVDENIPTKTKIIITTPKSSCSVRTIPITDMILELLCKLYNNQKGYLLTGLEDKYIEPRVMQQYFQKVIRMLSITPLSFHGLRHTFATRCVEKGIDIKSLSEILGHSDVSITMNRYVHPSMETKRKQMNRISEFLTVK